MAFVGYMAATMERAVRNADPAAGGVERARQIIHHKRDA